MILDPELFDYIEQHTEAILNRDPTAVEHLVVRSCQLKADVVRQDERETTGLRAILNYGHTFAHAIEAVTEYGTYLHGEAVAMGMTIGCGASSSAVDFFANRGRIANGVSLNGFNCQLDCEASTHGSFGR